MSGSNPGSEGVEITIGDYLEDEDMLAAVRPGSSLLRVRPWTGPPTAVLGRGSKVAAELNVERVRADKIPVLRRRGGGCTVLLDRGNLVISLVTRREGFGGSAEFFRRTSALIIASLETLDLPGVTQLGTSDLALGSHKISGSCIYRARELLYYTATLLVTPDERSIERYLSHPPREPDYREGRPHGTFLGRLDSLPACPSTAVLAADLQDELLRRLGDGWSTR